MILFSQILVGFVALQHIVFMILEMFFWTRPLGLKIFKQTPEIAEASAALAKNQGLYNGFLAAGLIWGLMLAPETYSVAIQVFFLICVAVAGIYGAFTAAWSIFFVQAVPALLALGILFW